MYLENITGTRRDEADLVHIYKNGLNSNIKVVLAVKDTHKLDEMKRTALEVDAAMRSTGVRPFIVNSNKNNITSTGYNKQYGNKPSAGKPSSNNYRAANGGHSAPFTTYPPSNTSNYNQWRSGSSSSNTGYAPMDIDKPGTRSISQNNYRGGYKSGNVNNQPPAGKCFNCGHSGHYIRQCPQNRGYNSKQRTNTIVQEGNIPDKDEACTIIELGSVSDVNSHKKLMTYMGMVNDKAALVMIDSGATNSYISKSFVDNHNVYTESTEQGVQAVLADGTSLSVIEYVPAADITIQGYHDTMDLTVLPVDKYDVILGMNWLSEHTPHTDYKTHTLMFKHHDRDIVLVPTVPITKQDIPIIDNSSIDKTSKSNQNHVSDISITEVNKHRAE
jgi:hypothetical protein